MRLYVATNRTVACSWYTSCRPIARDYDFIAESLSGKRFIGPCIIKRVSMLDCWASTREKQMDNVENYENYYQSWSSFVSLRNVNNKPVIIFILFTTRSKFGKLPIYSIYIHDYRFESIRLFNVTKIFFLAMSSSREEVPFLFNLGHVRERPCRKTYRPLWWRHLSRKWGTKPPSWLHAKNRRWIRGDLYPASRGDP